MVFTILLVFVPIAAIANYLGASPVIVFFLSAIAIVPLAKYIGQATEELAARTSAALGGFLNVTFGNATELIIGILALHSGLIDVVKASITGSIIGNLLLVLGTAIFAGGLKHKKMTFNRTAALASTTTLILAIIAFIMPALLPIAAPNVNAGSIQLLSVLVGICLVIVYIANLLFSLHTHKELYIQRVGDTDETVAKWSAAFSVTVLLISTLLVVWMSDILVGSIQPLVTSFGWTDLFIGVVILAIVGNAAEHASAILVAMKNKMDLALQISIGSAMQVAMFVAPTLVFISYLFQNQMNLVFNTFELVAILLAVIIVNVVVEDGETNWLEGVQLLVAYLIIAIAFFIHP